MTDPDEVILAAEAVSDILESRGVAAVVIGGVALVAHGYVRFTEDLDLGANTDLGSLNQVADSVRTAGFEADLGYHWHRGTSPFSPSSLECSRCASRRSRSRHARGVFRRTVA